EAVAVAFGDVELQRVVVGFASGFGVLRVRVEADERNAQRGVAAAEAFDERRNVFGSNARNGVTVRIDLAVDGIRRRGEVGLVEWNRDDFVDAVIADERERNPEVLARLPLKVDGVVLGIRKLVGRIVAGKDERAAKRDAVRGAERRRVVDELRDVGNERCDAGEIFWRRGRRRGAERGGEARTRYGVKRLRERF